MEDQNPVGDGTRQERYPEETPGDIGKRYREGEKSGAKATQRKAPRKVSGKLPGHYRKPAPYFSV